MFNSNSDTLDRSTNLLRRLHLLVDLRKRNAFDFLASLPDMDLFGAKGSKSFGEGDLELENNWNRISGFQGDFQEGEFN